MKARKGFLCKNLAHFMAHLCMVIGADYTTLRASNDKLPAICHRMDMFIRTSQQFRQNKK